MSQFERLISLANHLDSLNLFKEADVLDYIIVRLAMDLGEARSLLGVSPNASNDEIQKAWKIKALENHPDRGGDEEKMKAINVARDILLGERKPDRTYTPPSESYQKPTSHHYSRPDKVEKKVTFEEAAKAAGVPSGVKWKFKTDTQYTPYLGEMKAYGTVIYGATDDSHVFVGVQSFRDLNAFTNTDIDVYTMWVKEIPIKANLADIAPGTIRELWNNFNNRIKGYNAKVQLFDGDVAFEPRGVLYGSGRSIAFKDAMAILGNVPTTYDPKRKVEIIMELSTPQGEGWKFGENTITFVINGKPYVLSEANSKKLSGMYKLKKAIFGEYAYSGSKKVLTRQPADKRKVILDFLIKQLEGSEPDEVIEALKIASEQAVK